MQTKTKTIEMDNGIKVTLTVTDDGYTTNATMSTENMNVLVGTAVSHVGGRPSNPQ